MKHESSISQSKECPMEIPSWVVAVLDVHVQPALGV